ncbi:MAG: hypothetical protein ACYTXI_41895, partial [Nostoc sp.]
FTGGYLSANHTKTVEHCYNLYIYAHVAFRLLPTQPHQHGNTPTDLLILQRYDPKQNFVSRR